MEKTASSSVSLQGEIEGPRGKAHHPELCLGLVEHSTGAKAVNGASSGQVKRKRLQSGPPILSGVKEEDCFSGISFVTLKPGQILTTFDSI